MIQTPKCWSLVSGLTCRATLFQVQKSRKAAGAEEGKQAEIHTRKFKKVEEEFKAILGSGAQMSAIWRCLDVDGNGIVSLKELNMMVVSSRLWSSVHPVADWVKRPTAYPVAVDSVECPSRCRRSNDCLVV